MGFGKIKVQEKKDDKVFEDTEYEIIDDREQLMIIIKKPTDIRVNF